MIRFLIRRIILGLITLWVIVTLVFFLYYARPGVDPARELAGRAVTPATAHEPRQGVRVRQAGHRAVLELPAAPVEPGHFNLGTSNTDRLPVTTDHRSGGPHRHLARGGIGDSLDGRSASVSVCWRPDDLEVSGTAGPRCSCSPGSRCRLSSSGCCCYTSCITYSRSMASRSFRNRAAGPRSRRILWSGRTT